MHRLLLAALVAVFVFASAHVAAQSNAKAPKFAVDPFWPKPLPENWILGQVAGIAVDGQDNVWIMHRPRTLVDDEKGAQKTPPETSCCKAAPAGHGVRRRRQPAEELGRPGHRLRVAQERARHPRRQGGQRLARRQRRGRPDPAIHAATANSCCRSARTTAPRAAPTARRGSAGPAHMVTDDAGQRALRRRRLRQPPRHRVRRQDRRLQAPLGRLRHQAADRRQAAALQAGRSPSCRSRSPTPCTACALSRDGLVYVCDRANDRIQVFKKDGTFVKEFQVEPQTLQNGSVWDLVLSEDAAQRYIFVADGANMQVITLDRQTGEKLAQLRPPRPHGRQLQVGAQHGDRQQGQLYTAEVGDRPPRAEVQADGRLISASPPSRRRPSSRKPSRRRAIRDLPHARLVRSPPPPPLALDNAAWQAGQSCGAASNVPRAGRLREHCRHRLRPRCRAAGSRVRDRTVYRYRGVPQDVYEDFREAPSKGAFFNQHIKDAYPWEQVV